MYRSQNNTVLALIQVCDFGNCVLKVAVT